MGLAVISAFAVFLIMWSISVRRRLARVDEHINNAMNQIGIQLAAQYDALTDLVDVAKGYDGRKGQMLKEMLQSGRSSINALSEPEEVRWQEEVIVEVLESVDGVAECYPELKSSEEYITRRNAVESYGKMLCTSSLIYNDSVNKLNREVRRFPTSLPAAILGFHRRAYLETSASLCKEVRGILEFSSQ